MKYELPDKLQEAHRLAHYKPTPRQCAVHAGLHFREGARRAGSWAARLLQTKVRSGWGALASPSPLLQSALLLGYCHRYSARRSRCSWNNGCVCQAFALRLSNDSPSRFAAQACCGITCFKASQAGCGASPELALGSYRHSLHTKSGMACLGRPIGVTCTGGERTAPCTPQCPASYLLSATGCRVRLQHPSAQRAGGAAPRHAAADVHLGFQGVQGSKLASGPT